MQRRDLLSHLSLGCLGSLGTSLALATQPPSLWLASQYQGDEKLSDYWVSEKYDGLRGYWNGHQLLSRSGKSLNPPDWFVQTWPAHPFEGELWAGPGQFEHTASVIQQKQASDSAWRTIRLMVFDAYTPAQTFTQRIERYERLVKQIGKPWVHAVAQHQVTSHVALKSLLNKTVEAGGEGLVLHLGSSLYQSGRHTGVLKVKSHEDAEARVIGHELGQGKHAHRLGALWVQTQQGLRFKLGTGFTDSQRENPPAVGQWVTYSYRGLTDNGIPRFASFVRIRPTVER